MNPHNDKSIILVGAGGHAAACADVIRESGRFSILGLIGRWEDAGKVIYGIPVLGTDVELITPGNRIAQSALVAVGQIKTPDIRIRLFKSLSAAGYCMPRIISPLAHVSPAALLGAGTIVMHGAIISVGASVGTNCIINSRALVEHGAIIGDHCHVSTAAVVNGDAEIGHGVFIGSGAVIREGVKIGTRCVVGMGALVLHDLPDGVVFHGNQPHGA